MSVVVCFHGADHKCGTTMVSQCAAEALSQLLPERRVLLLHPHGAFGTEYSPMVSEAMESLKPYLAEKLLDPGELLERARWRGNLHVVGGAGETGSIFSYHPDMGSYLVGALRDSADYILCDCGCDIEHGLSLGSLMASDRIYLVLSQRESAVAAYEGSRQLLQRLGLKPYAHVVNQFDKSSPYTLRYLSERLELDKDNFRKLRASDYGMQAETDGRSLMNYQGRGFLKDVNAFAEELAEAAEETQQQ